MTNEIAKTVAVSEVNLAFNKLYYIFWVHKHLRGSSELDFL